mmetsp:Transcript_7873/g.11471  ORF Transcript_7873/g.11471 Transcript_7873/m.11471 type:complete len:361 (-) Transcript_7873:102-1184(-)
MNFDRFKSRLQESAEAAANAARNLQSFDQMAAQDDYVHSPDLKVSTSRSRPRQEPNRQQGLENSNGRRPPPQPSQRQDPMPISRAPSTVSQMLPMVANTMSESPIISSMSGSASNASVSQKAPANANSRKQREKPSFLTSFSSMADSDEEYDPVLERLNAANQAYHSVEKEDVIANNVPTVTTKKKNPNRFMEDLEERMAKVEEPSPAPAPSPPPPRPTEKSAEPTTSMANNLLGWAKSTRLGKNLASAGIVLESSDASEVEMKGILSRRVEEQNVNDDHTEDDIENSPIQVVSGSMVLDAAEQAELDRMKSGSSGSGLLSMMLSLLKQHPHHAFIGLTLVLYLVVYFYTRHRGNEDDVT